MFIPNVTSLRQEKHLLIKEKMKVMIRHLYIPGEHERVKNVTTLSHGGVPNHHEGIASQPRIAQLHCFCSFVMTYRVVKAVKMSSKWQVGSTLMMVRHTAMGGM